MVLFFLIVLVLSYAVIRGDVVFVALFIIEAILLISKTKGSGVEWKVLPRKSKPSLSITEITHVTVSFFDEALAECLRILKPIRPPKRREIIRLCQGRLWTVQSWSKPTSDGFLQDDVTILVHSSGTHSGCWNGEAGLVAWKVVDVGRWC